MKFGSRSRRHIIYVSTFILLLTAFWIFLLKDYASFDGFSRNDTSAHTRMVQSVIEMFQNKELNLDQWQTGMSIGSPLFRVYQHWPHLLAGTFGYLLGWNASHSVHFFICLFWCLQFPCWYLASRWMGLSKLESVCVLLVAPLIQAWVGLGHELRSYLYYGLGLFTQCVAFPPTILFTGRMVRFLGFAEAKESPTKGVGFALGIGLGTVFLLHQYYGTLLAFFFILGLAFSLLRKRISFDANLFSALFYMALGFFLLTSYQLLSIFQDLPLQHQIVTVMEDERINGWGLLKTIRMFFLGQYFDSSRWPFFSLLFLVGLLAALLTKWRMTFVFLLPLISSILLMSGRKGLGPIFDWIPGINMIQNERFIVLAQFSGIYFAAHGISFFLNRIQTRVRAPLKQKLLFLLVLLPVFYLYWDRLNYIAVNRLFIRRQNEARSQLATKIVDHIWAHRKGNVWQPFSEDKERLPPVLGIVMYDAVFSELGIPMMNHATDQASYGSDVVIQIAKDWKLSSLIAYNIQYVLLRSESKPLPYLHAILKDRGLTLYEVDSYPGDWDVIRIPTVVKVENTTEWHVMTFDWLSTKDIENHFYPSFVPIAAAKAYPEGVPPVQDRTFLFSPLGRVVEQALIKNGKSKATLFATDDHQYGLVRAAYHPRWKIVRNGARVSPLWVTPGFFAFPLATGENKVTIEFEKDVVREVLFFISLAVFLSTCLVVIGWATLRNRLSSGNPNFSIPE